MYDIGQSLAELKKGQEAHAKQIDDLMHRLFGNGTPGAVGKIEDRVTVLEAVAHSLKGSLDSFKAVWSSVTTAVLVVIAILEYLFRSGHSK